MTNAELNKVLGYWNNNFDFITPSFSSTIIPFKYTAITYDNLSEKIIRGKNEQDYLVEIASGEQLFLYLFFQNKFEFKEDIMYKVRTACYRPRDNEPPFSLPKFHKTEIFIRNNNNNTLSELKKSADELVTNAKKAFAAGGLDSKKITTKLVTDKEQGFCLEESKGKCEEIYQLDVMYEDKFELGSYGLREYTTDGKKLIWTYGTMLAEERFCAVKNYQDEYKQGYHLTEIPKGELGQPSKITEEYLEFMDAIKQNNKILALVELSDMIGAIESYLETNCEGITIKDVINMTRVTQRAFKNGKR